MQTPQSNGGAALRARSDDSSDEAGLFLLLLTSVLWGPIALFLLVSIFCLIMDFGLFCWSICRKLARIFYLVACRMKRLFKQLSLLVSVRNAVAQVTSNEQQTTPESIEMGNVRPSSLEIPSEYEHYCPHEEPLPVEPLPVYKP